MQVNAQQIFRDLDEGKWKPFYLVVGEEPFQAGEIASRVKAFFLKDEQSSLFNHESFDGEHLDASALLGSLDTLPGLFDIPGVHGEALRLVSCSRFDKISPAGLELLDGYFRNPSPSTCFLIFASKVDKRKGWFRSIDEKGYVVEVSEPYDREWPKWQGYFERKIKKKIESAAWEMLVESSNRSLSILWAEVQKLATFVGESPTMTHRDYSALATSSTGDDIFAFAEDVLCRRGFFAMRRFHHLIRSGENEIKLLSILVRQFRMVEQALLLSKSGVTDSKTLASRIGTHPFFVTKILNQSKHHTEKTLSQAICLLADCDFHLKTGDGNLFEHFLLPYFSTAA